MRNASLIHGCILATITLVLFSHGLTVDAPGELFRHPTCLPMSLSLAAIGLIGGVAIFQGLTWRSIFILAPLSGIVCLIRPGVPWAATLPASLALMTVPFLAMCAPLVKKRVLIRILGATGICYAAHSLYCWWDYQLAPELARRAIAEIAFGQKIIAGSLFSDRNTLTLGHANFNGGVATLILPLIAYLAWQDRHERWRLAWFAGVPLAAALLWSSGSRAGFIGLAVAAIFAVIQLAITGSLSRKHKMLIGAISVGGITSLALLHPRTREVLANPISLLQSDAERWELAKTGWRLFLEKPWFGHGVGSIPSIYPAAWSGDGVLTNSWQLHITPLNLAVECGGIVATAWILIPLFIFPAWRKSPFGSPTNIAATTVIGYWAFAWFDYQLNVPFIAMIFGLILGTALPIEGKAPAVIIPTFFRYSVASLIMIPTLWTAGRFLSERHLIVRHDFAQISQERSDPVALTMVAAEKLTAGRIDASNLTIRRSLLLNPQSACAWKLAALTQEARGKHDLHITALAIHALIEPEFMFSPEWSFGPLSPLRPEFLRKVTELESDLRKSHPDDVNLAAALEYRRTLLTHYQLHGGTLVAFLSFRESSDSGKKPTMPALLQETAKDNDPKKLRALGYFTRRLFNDKEAAEMLAHLRGEKQLPPIMAAYTFPSYNLLFGTLEAPVPTAPVADIRDAAFDLIWPDIAPMQGRIPGAWLKRQAESVTR